MAAINSLAFLTRKTAKGAPVSIFKKAQKQAKKWFNAQKRKVDAWAREHFARYMVLDTYGTCQLCFTMADAMDWLKFCSPDARIVCAETGALIAGRSWAEVE